MSATKTKEVYVEGIGRRKCSIARVRVTPAKKNTFVVNEKPLEEYFKTDDLKNVAQEALTKVEGVGTYSVSVKIVGGGTASQAESLRLGLSRALVEIDPELRKSLKKEGFLKRDPRIIERKKFGLKKARKSPQWSKR